MDGRRLEVLKAIADTVVPRLERADDPDGFWARSGSDVGAQEGVAGAIETMPPAQREGLGYLLDGLARAGFLDASRRSREQILRNLAALGPQAAAGGMPTWRVGDNVEFYLERLKRVPLRAGGFKLFAAHQMGSCRMGSDAQTSVAGPYGELHDTPGVWIGDASAFPTASGTNPMITIMALARRSGEAIVAASPAAATRITA